ncbi:MAG: hypothetical protein M3142_10740 [Bacteroidota bacterium]|nr:hypothetical protein [Bacteroidota bacterium]
MQTSIRAPKEVCFDLSRSINLLVISTKHTGEKAIAGRTNKSWCEAQASCLPIWEASGRAN